MQKNLATRIVFILFSMISMISVFSCIKEPKVAERQRKGTGKVIKYTTCKFHAAVWSANVCFSALCWGYAITVLQSTHKKHKS